jgi:hypothetical protein
MNLVSDEAFRWILTILTGGFAGTWLVYDAISLVRSRREDRKRDPLIHDKRFGYVIGMLVGFIGVWGCLRFHGVV